jgi:hypothetical protein
VPKAVLTTRLVTSESQPGELLVCLRSSEEGQPCLRF